MKFRQSRRIFLNEIIGAGMAISLGKFSTPAFGQNAASENSSKTMLFSKQLEWIKDYEELCEVAAEIGFDGLELTVRPGGYILPERVEEDLPRMADAAKKAGIEILMITTQIIDQRDPFAERILTAAKKLGIRFYRMGGLSYKESMTVEQNLQEFKSIFKDLGEMNQQYDIHGAYQNHAGSNRMSASIWDLWFILKELDPRWIGCQYDTRHAQVEGGSWWPVGLELLSSHIKTTVVKDFQWIQDGDQWKAQNCPVGEGAVDFQKHFAGIKKHQIQGPISLHFPYTFLEGEDKLSKKVRFEKTITIMKEKGLKPLNTMLGQAGLS